MRVMWCILAFCLLIVACNAAPSVQTSTATNTTAMPQGAIVGDVVVQQEIARLLVLVNNASATEADFTRLSWLVAHDNYAIDEIGEITTMVHYKEYAHAAHGLGFIDSYVQTGKKSICPGHELSHYYVFSIHGESDRAADALASAKQDLVLWEPKARAYVAQYPGKQNFTAMDSIITTHLDAIVHGNNTASDEEITALSDMLCVEE